MVTYEEKTSDSTLRNEMEFWMKGDRVRAESKVSGQNGVEMKGVRLRTAISNMFIQKTVLTD